MLLQERTGYHRHPIGPTARSGHAFDAHCPSQLVIERIADGWSVIVLHALKDATKRYGELKRTIGGVSPKMLTQTLRRLERYGFVARKVYPTVPLRSEYALTHLGETLSEPLAALCRWTESHLDALADQPDSRPRRVRATPRATGSAAR
jgi:DNA-binding HxlR family transcriptional regulator